MSYFLLETSWEKKISTSASSSGTGSSLLLCMFWKRCRSGSNGALVPCVERSLSISLVPLSQRRKSSRTADSSWLVGHNNRWAEKLDLALTNKQVIRRSGYLSVPLWTASSSRMAKARCWSWRGMLHLMLALPCTSLFTKETRDENHTKLCNL